MLTHNQTGLRITATLPVNLQPWREQHESFEITLFGRYMLACKNEFPCSLRKLSVAGAEISSLHAVSEGERIVAYFDRLGGLEGKATEILDGGFAMEFSMTQRRRQKLMTQLYVLSQQDSLHSAAIGHSSQEQLQLADRSIRVSFEDGRVESCHAEHTSISSALLISANRPPVGTLLTVGKLRARVMNHHDKGFGVAFIDIREAAAVRRHFG